MIYVWNTTLIGLQLDPAAATITGRGGGGGGYINIEFIGTFLCCFSKIK